MQLDTDVAYVVIWQKVEARRGSLRGEMGEKRLFSLSFVGECCSAFFARGPIARGLAYGE